MEKSKAKGLPRRIIWKRIAGLSVIITVIFVIGGIVYSNTAFAYYVQGLQHKAANEFREALVDFTTAIERNPDYFQAYYERGIIYTALNHTNEALEDYRILRQLAPDYAAQVQLQLGISNLGLSSDLIHRGNLYGHLGQYAAAAADYTKAIEIEPESTRYYIGRARLYTLAGQYDQAVADYDHILDVYPTDAYALLSSGIVYAQLGQIDQANEHLNQANIHYHEFFQDDPYSPYINANIGIVHYFLKNYEQALAYSDNAVRLGHPNVHQPMANRGHALAALGQYNEAIASFEHVIQITPDFADPYWGLGNVYYEQGMLALALENYRRYLALFDMNSVVFTIPQAMFESQERIAEIEAQLNADYRGG